MSEATERKLHQELSEISFIGGNRKGVVIIVNQSAHKLSNADLEFITNVMKACQFTLDDVAIINIRRQPFSYQQLTQSLGAKYLILFETAPTDIGMQFEVPYFQLQSYAGMNLITAPPLALLQAGSSDAKANKTLLWNSLRRMFNL